MNTNYCIIKHDHNPKDLNGYGQVPYTFFMQQNFISLIEYISFLNELDYALSIDLDLFIPGKTQNIIYEKNEFKVADGLNPLDPMTHININNIKVYANWLNHKDISLITKYPYHINNNTKDYSKVHEFWIPNYNEYYKSTYYDTKNKTYYKFPNCSNTEIINEQHNHLSPYGLINAGFKKYNIIDDEKPENNQTYLIAGGSSNRSPLNASAGIIKKVSKTYKSDYISARLCKKSNSIDIRIEMYDTFGDGWGENHLVIIDRSGQIIHGCGRLSLNGGYGPLVVNINIDSIEEYITVKYIKQNQHSYENYYKIYVNDITTFESKVHESPPEYQKIHLKRTV
jgi:hypothetical protein